MAKKVKVLVKSVDGVNAKVLSEMVNKPERSITEAKLLQTFWKRYYNASFSFILFLYILIRISHNMNRIGFKFARMIFRA